MALQGNKEQNSLPRDLYQIRISLKKVERNYEMKTWKFPWQWWTNRKQKAEAIFGAFDFKAMYILILNIFYWTFIDP